MESGETQQLGPIRQVTIDALCDHFANDVMPVEEFERRVELAHRAKSVDDLKALLRDLPGGNLPAATGPGSTAPAPLSQRPYRVTSAAHVKERDIVLAVMGGAVRKAYEVPASLFGALDGRVTYVVGKDGACVRG